MILSNGFFFLILLYFSLETILPTFLKLQLGKQPCHWQSPRESKSRCSLDHPRQCLQHHYSNAKQSLSFSFSKKFLKREGRTTVQCFTWHKRKRGITAVNRIIDICLVVQTDLTIPCCSSTTLEFSERNRLLFSTPWYRFCLETLPKT